MNRSTFLKVLALTLAFMLVFSCAGVSAFAEDFSTGDVQYLIVRPSKNDESKVWVEAIGKDGEEIWKVDASGATVQTGDVDSPVWTMHILLKSHQTRLMSPCLPVMSIMVLRMNRRLS